MNADELKGMLTQEDMIGFLGSLGAEPVLKNGALVNKTVCHNGCGEGSHKLYYYHESKMFKCYSECEKGFDVFGLVRKIKECDFYTSFKIVCEYFNISYINVSGKHIEKLDMSFFKRFEQNDVEIKLPVLDQSELKSFYEGVYHESWVNDGISVESMRKHNIMFSISNNQIIIPHYNAEGQLIGIRCRNLNKEAVEKGFKYMPVFNNGKLLNHATGSMLYGLDKNKKEIEKHRKIIICESEKAVLQIESMNEIPSIAVSVSGSSITNHQLKLIKELDIDEVIIALDKEFEKVGDNKEIFYGNKIKKVFVNPLIIFFNVSIIWDVKNLIDLKDSPSDKGEEVFKNLFYNRIKIK